MQDGLVLLAGGGLLGFLTGSVWPWLMVVAGIGLVIFVHELGHFWAAKLCGVRVEVFSLGFGPRIFGFRRGNTDYRLSIVPLGGYVKMAGDTPGENNRAPDALSSKGVGQRIFIYSAGVIMNMIFALVSFPVVFGAGVPFNKPTVGQVAPGSAAWRAGLQAGDEILRVGENDVYGFTDILTEVALGDPQGIPFQIQRPGEDAPRTVTVVPVWNEALGRYVAGISQEFSTKVDAVIPDGPAERAGVQAGDLILRLDEQRIDRGNELGVHLMTKETIALTVLRDDKEHTLQVKGEAPKKPPTRIGISPVSNLVIGLRGTARESGLLVDDRVLSVNGQEIVSEETWKDAISAPGDFSIRVERDLGTPTLELPAALREALLTDVAIGQDRDATRVVIAEDSPASSAGLTNGVRLVEVNGKRVETFSQIQESVGGHESGPIAFKVFDGNVETQVDITPKPMPVAYEFGLSVAASEVTRQFGFMGAMKAGWRSSIYWTKSTYLTLKKMIVGQVSTKNLGGIISIGYVSRSFADSGLAKLLFFLAVLSINLAFVNLLPVPILDGGHIVFLLIEKIKGSPVSDRVLGYSQVLGLVMILALLLYVTYNDIVRLL